MNKHNREPGAEVCDCKDCKLRVSLRRWIRGVAFASGLEVGAKKIRERADKLACEITEYERFCYFIETGRHYGDMLDAEVRRTTQEHVDNLTAVYVKHSTFYTGEA